MEAKTITPEELQKLYHADPSLELIDVRTPAEFQELHVAFARNVPLDQLDPPKLLQGRNGQSGKPLYVICRSGSRGKQACQKLINCGFEDAVNVEGGTLACRDAQLPLVTGRKVISLERQVRIAAGFLVLTGSLLGYFVHPYFLAIPAFVGAGLMFAGITDTCGMAMLLAKMPWNR